MTEVLPKVTEFWLKKYPDSPSEEHIGLYRVTLGELIDARDRKTYKPTLGSYSFDFYNKSGSIGFMDVAIKDISAPKEDATPFPNPDNLYFLSYQYTEFERVRALVIHTIAIEPEYRRNGYAKLLKSRAEQIALEQGLGVVVSENTDNPIMQEFNARLGYVLFNCGRSAVKRLKSEV